MCIIPAMYSRSIVLNIICVALAVGVAAGYCGLPVAVSGVFVALVLWLCNEAWYVAASLPALLAGAWTAVRRKRISASVEKKIYHATACLLLLVPHVLFAVLYVADSLTSGLVADELGLPISTSMFGCAYLAVVLLWFCSLFRAVNPMSLEVLWTFLFEPELYQTQEDEAAAAPASPSLPDAPADAPRHPELRKLAADDLLYYGRPEPGVLNPHLRTRLVVGAVLLLLVLLVAGMAVQCYPVSLAGCALCGLLALVFGGVAVSLLRSPGRWRDKLSRAEYAVTREAVYVAEGQELRRYPLDKKLALFYEEVSGGTGSIHLDHPTLHKGTLGKLFARAGAVNVSAQNDLSAPLSGIVQIPAARQVYQLIKELQNGLLLLLLLGAALLSGTVQAGEMMVTHGVKESASRKFVKGNPSPEVLRSLVRKMNKSFSKRGFSLKGGYGFTMETACVLPSGMDEDDVLDCIPGYECYETIEFHTSPDGRRYFIRPGLIDYRDTTYAVSIWFGVTSNRDYRKSRFFR